MRELSIRKARRQRTMAFLSAPAAEVRQLESRLLQTSNLQTFSIPVSASVINGFDSLTGEHPGYFHTGYDYAAPRGTPVSATAYGDVYAMFKVGTYESHRMGNSVIVRHFVPIDSLGHTMTVYSVYSHLDSFENGIYVGKQVSNATWLGRVGSTGTTSPHLHFEIKSAGILGNPSGPGQYWGYVPPTATLRSATAYGYYNPADFIGQRQAKR